MRTLFIADEPMGQCAGCGTALDVNDWIAIREGLPVTQRLAHPGDGPHSQSRRRQDFYLLTGGLEVIEQAKEAIG